MHFKQTIYLPLSIIHAIVYASMDPHAMSATVGKAKIPGLQATSDTKTMSLPVLRSDHK